MKLENLKPAKGANYNSAARPWTRFREGWYFHTWYPKAQARAGYEHKIEPEGGRCPSRDSFLSSDSRTHANQSKAVNVAAIQALLAEQAGRAEIGSGVHQGRRTCRRQGTCKGSWQRRDHRSRHCDRGRVLRFRCLQDRRPLEVRQS